jgi:hypothetical protein
MDSNLRNADSGLDLDDSGSGGDTFRPESRGGGTNSARGKNMCCLVYCIKYRKAFISY